MADNRTTEFELVYDMSDVTAKEDATPTAQSYKYFDDDIILDDNILDSRMTLEHNFCVLDGTQSEFKDDTSDIPFFSELTTINGLFRAMTLITMWFSELHSSYALTINFMDDYPLLIKCTWYRDNDKLFESEYDVDCNDFVIRKSVQNYDKIQIEFLKTLPFRYVKVNYIRFGVILDWNENNLKSGNLLMEIDPISSALPESNLTFEVVDDTDETNPGNKEGLHNYFQRNQSMQPYEIVNGNKIKLGKFYLQDFSYNKNVCKVQTTTLLTLMENTDFSAIGTASKANDPMHTPRPNDYKSATYWLELIFAEIGLTSSDYSIDASLSSVNLYFGFAEMSCNCKQALQEVLFAANAIVDFSSNVYDVVVKPRTSVVSGIIPKTTKFSTSVKKTEYVTGVKIHYNTIVWAATDSNNMYIINERMKAGTYKIIFNELRAMFSITQEQQGDFGYSNYTTNHLTLTVNRDNALVQLSSIFIGQWKTDKFVEVDRPVIEAGQWVNVKEFTTSFCNEETATALAKKLLAYYDNRLEIDIKNLVTTSSVGIDEQWIIQNSTTGMDDYLARYTQRSIDLVKGFIDSAKMIGMFDTSATELYLKTQDYELYTDDNEVI